MPAADAHINKELFLRLAEGDEHAFREIFHYYTPRLQPFVLSIVKSAAIAEEIVQEVFLKLWINREKVAEKDMPSSWLFTVAAHHAFTFLKRMATEKRFIDTMQQQVQTSALDNATERQVFTREGEALLQEAIKALPRQRQIIYRLSRTEGLTHKQIAQQLNISPSTVKNQLVTALRSIQEFLRKAGSLMALLLAGLLR